MFLKIVLVSLIFSIPAVIIGAAIQGGVSASMFQESAFWLSNIYTFCSYSVVAVLAWFIAGKLGFSALASVASVVSSSDSNREEGTVKWFSSNKGYGFITRSQGDDVFVHYRSLSGKGHRSLFEGQVVTFSVSDGDKGLQADDVEVQSGGPKRRTGGQGRR